MQDAADHPAIVDAGLAGFAARQMRFQAGPGTIRQPKQARHHTPPDQQSPFRRIEPKLRQEFVWVPYLGLLGGYALLGAGWLIWRSGGVTEAFAREAGHTALVVTAVMMVVVSAWTALADPVVARLWFAWPNVIVLAPFPIATALVIFAAWHSLRGPREALPFVLGILIFMLGFGGLIVSL